MLTWPRPTCPATLDVLTIAPPPFLSITGISWRIELRRPHTLMSKMRRYSASVACSSGPVHSTPALLKAMSSFPNFSTVKSTIFFTSASLATSARTNAASPPSFLISATTCAPSFSRLPERTTFAPPRANAIAVALPMPEVPPVTSATLPANVLLLFIFFRFPEWIKSASLPCSLGLVRHRQDHAKSNPAAVHLLVSFGYTRERIFLDHRMDAAQRAEFQCVLRIARRSRVGSRHGSSSHN